MEVAECDGDDQPTDRWLGAASHRLRRFALLDSAGLRVRTGPSLQAEELGRVPAGAYVAIVEEVM